jgi:chromosome segregation ATPase
MTPENQPLLDAIRGIVHDAVVPILTRLGGLETRIGVIESRIDAIESRIGVIESRIGVIESRIGVIESRIDTLDARTAQLATDLFYLRERVPLLEERMDNGFRALKSDLTMAFSDIRKITTGQDRHEHSIETLRRAMLELQQRLSALEQGRGAS